MSSKSELYGGPAGPSTESIFACIEKGYTKHPDKIAVVSRTQGGHHLVETVLHATSSFPSSTSDTCLRWTYSEFASVADNLTEGLLQSTPARSDSLIVTFVPNCVEWLLLLSASMLAKVGIACLDIDMLKKPRRAELEAKLLQLRPSYVVVADDAGAVAVDSVLQEQDLGAVLKVTLDNKSPQATTNDWIGFASLCKPSSLFLIEQRREAARHDGLDRTAMVVYTSGTSGGMPKACIRHVASIIGSVSNHNFTHPGHASDSVRILQTANFRAIAPAIATGAWRDGATIILAEYPFNPESFLDDCEQEKVTMAALIPAQLHAVVASPSFSSRDLSSLKVVASGGDIVTSALVKYANRYFPQATFVVAHGMSECGGLFQWPYWDGSGSIPFHQGISPLGRLSPGARIRLVSEDGSVVPRGVVGDLHIHHASVFKTYLREKREMPEFYTDGIGKWFKTGDLALISEAGDVYIVGRSKDIKRAAVSIAPAAIESCLQSYTGSLTVVIGKPHPTLGQEPFAIAQNFNGKKAEDLAAHVIEMFGPDWKLGGAVELEALGLGSFPLNPSGKIQKSDLAVPFAEYLAAAA